MDGTRVTIRTRCNDELQWPYSLALYNPARDDAEEGLHRLAQQLGGCQGAEDEKGFDILFDRAGNAEHFESVADQRGFTTERI